MGLDLGTVLIMLLRWVGTLVLVFALIVMVSLVVDGARDWSKARLRKR